jgi:hypothetical protein
VRPLAIAAALVCVLAGCGLGEGEERGGDTATLRVTRDFGHELLASGYGKVREGGTPMRLLRANAKVETRYGGGFVQSIDGLEGGGAGGSVDWFYFVNGVQPDTGAAEYELSPGDVVQWDYRAWRATPEVRAIVGAFPEPFVHGIRGKRRPVRVECDDGGSGPCRGVKRALAEVGVTATGSSLGAPGTRNVIRVVVAAWDRARELPTVRRLERGSQESGVFARFRDGGRRLELLNPRGAPARTEDEQTGLVAALLPRDDELLWVITGGSGAAVGRAARAFDARRLRDAFAVAAPPGKTVKLPLEAGG